MFNETEIKQIVAISVLLAATKCTKFVLGRGSAPDPAGGAHDAPQTPSRLDTGHPLPIPTPSAPTASRFSRLWCSSRRLWRLASSVPPLLFHSLSTACRCCALANHFENSVVRLAPSKFAAHYWNSCSRGLTLFDASAASTALEQVLRNTHVANLHRPSINKANLACNIDSEKKENQ